MTDLMSQDTAEADALAADLERRIAEGDTTITPADVEAVEAAHKRGVFAQMRDRASTNRAAKQAEAQRVARISELRRQAAEEFDGTDLAPVVEAFDAAVEAVTEVARRATDRNRRLQAIADELRTLGPLPADIARTAEGVRVGKMGEHRWINPVEFSNLVAEVRWRAMREVVGDRAALPLRSAAAVVQPPGRGAEPVGPSDALREQVESATR
jgi:hypothetical protein